MFKKTSLFILILPITVFAISDIVVAKGAFDNGTVIAKNANSYIGIPYVWGGNSLINGLDCSAFVKILVKNYTGKELPRTAKNQALKADKVTDITSFSKLQVGDAIYFKNKKGHIHHVALVTGFDHEDGYPIITHAKGKKFGVVREKISKKYINEFYVGKRFNNPIRSPVIISENRVKRSSKKEIKTIKFDDPIKINNKKYKPLLLKNI